MSNSLSFIYLNSKDELSARTVRNISEKGAYFQGFCLMDNAVKTFRHDRIIEKVGTESELPERFAYWEKNPPAFYPRSESHRHILKRDENTTFEICFTGFKTEDKARLSKVATDAKMIVRSAVTEYLDILCYGYNAGPKKLELALAKNILILSEPQLMTLIETGEIPES
jgi:predicted DNA-binding transcriptional regulator YafY